MKNYSSAGKKFNKTLFCVYQATSDDLMVWCWFNVLILSMHYGLGMAQISLVFSVSFWVALLMKLPGSFIAGKLRAGRCVLLSAFLFLAASLILTFGHSLPAAIAGQSIYLIAGSYQEMATVIAKRAAAKDPARLDYMRLMSAAGAVNSVISLTAALLMSMIYRINENLPMYICVGFCVSSCILAWFVSRWDDEEAAGAAMAGRQVLPGLKLHSFDRTTISCLFLSILFMVVFTVSGDNLKILLENNIDVIADKTGTVFGFSMILLASRVIKIISNLLLYRSRGRRIDQGKVLSGVVAGVVLMSVIAFANSFGSGYFAVIPATVAFLIRVMVFDPFRFSIYDFMLKRLQEEKMTRVLFVHSAGIDIFTAVFSTISTVLLKFRGMESVMFMLLLISLIFAAGYFFLSRYLVRTIGRRDFLNWAVPGQSEQTAQAEQNDLLTAAAALLLHYGVVRDASFTPGKLTEKVSRAEDIHEAVSHVRFDGYLPYREETLKELFNAGHPCAVKALIHEGEREYWLPVMYLDDDGSVAWNPYGEERFLAQFVRITQIASFTIS